jgi:hypothetical protein
VLAAIDIFEFAKIGSFVDFGCQLFTKQVSFSQRFDDGIAALVEFGKLFEPVSDSLNLNFIERTGSFFAITRDKRHSAAFVEQLCGRHYLQVTYLEFIGYTGKPLVIHQQTSNYMRNLIEKKSEEKTITRTRKRKRTITITITITILE